MKSKKSLLAMVLFIAISCFINSQTGGSDSKDTASNVTSGTESSFESNLSYFNTENTAGDSGLDYKAPSTTGFIVKTIVVLILVVGAIYGIMFFFKKKTKGTPDFLGRGCDIYSDISSIFWAAVRSGVFKKWL